MPITVLITLPILFSYALSCTEPASRSSIWVSKTVLSSRAPILDSFSVCDSKFSSILRSAEAAGLQTAVVLVAVARTVLVLVTVEVEVVTDVEVLTLWGSKLAL